MLPVADPSAPLTAWLLLPPATALGFFLAGRAAFSGLASPLPWATAYVGSLLLVFFASLGLDTTGIPISPPSLILAVMTLALVGWFAAGRPSLLPRFKPTAISRLHLFNWRETLWLVPCAAAFGAILLHALAEPLSGWDTTFRWNYLALLVDARGSLAHYPPVTAEDFRLYPWVDGIPPLIPLLNLWIYSTTGSTAGVLTIGRLAVELGLTLALVWRLSRQLWGPPGARASLFLLATSTIFAWSLAIGQETGTTGVLLILLANLFHAYHRAPATATAVWIGLTAAATALCRDYNLLFIPVGLALLAFRASRRDLFAATLAAALVACPWYVRNAWLTGNPLYPHALGGLLPTNARYADCMTVARAATSPFLHADALPSLLRTLLVGSGLLALASLPGWLRRDFRWIAPLALAITGVVLWALSATATGGGWNYSLRVLGIVAPLLAVAAGWWGGKLRGAGVLVAGLVLSLVMADTARRARLMFYNPLIAPWPYEWKTSDIYHRSIKGVETQPAFGALVAAAQGEAIIVDLPGYFIYFGRLGGNIISQFSPEAAPLFTAPPSTPLTETLRTLRQAGVRFVFLAQTADGKMDWINATPSLAQLWATPPHINAGIARVYDLALLAGESPSIVLQLPP